MKKGKAALEILAFLTVVVVTSGIILLLVQSGVVSVEGGEGQPVLNTEFLPLGRIGTLQLQSVSFCGFLDEDFQCFDEKRTFEKGDEIFVLLVVETSTYSNSVTLTSNYRITDPAGKVIYELEESNAAPFSTNSQASRELVALGDVFNTDGGYLSGEYQIDIVVKNPLLDKQVTKKELITIR